MVDRVVIRPDQRRRLTDAVEIASALSGGLVLADIPEDEARDPLLAELRLRRLRHLASRSSRRACSRSTAPTARARPARGLGTRLRIDPDAHHSGPVEVSSSDRAVSPRAAGTASRTRASARMYYDALAKKYHFDLATPIRRPAQEHVREILLYGTGGRGAAPCTTTQIAAAACCAARLRASSATSSAAIRRRRAMPCGHRLEDCMAEYGLPGLPRCASAAGGAGRHGRRAEYIRIYGAADHGGAGVSSTGSTLSEKDAQIADSILREVRSRLHFFAERRACSI